MALNVLKGGYFVNDQKSFLNLQRALPGKLLAEKGDFVRLAHDLADKIDYLFNDFVRRRIR